MSIDLEELKHLPVADKLRIVEFLWDEIGAAEETLPADSWQLREAARRASEIRQDPSLAIDGEELWRRVDG